VLFGKLLALGLGPRSDPYLITTAYCYDVEYGSLPANVQLVITITQYLHLIFTSVPISGQLSR